MKWFCRLLPILLCPLTAAAQEKNGYTPVIEPGACPIKIDSSFATRCGYLLVPENRNKKNTATIRLPFIVLRSKNPDKKNDPLLFTGGGPGNSSLAWIAGMTKSSVIATRDCIAFEQRGTRYAIPYLRLFDLDTAIKQSYRRNLPKDSMYLVGVQHYRKNLEAKGIDLAGYNSDETVADIDDLLITLGIDSVNLLGGSYSGGLMMAVLQKDPARVRSLVLDSPLPMFSPVDEDEPAHFNEALKVLSSYCEKDSADRERYGNLFEKFRGYFTAIKDKVFYMPYLEKGAADSIQVQYNKNDLLDQIENGLFNQKAIKDVPFMITEMIRGNHRPYIQNRLNNIFLKNIAPDGMRISVYCADQAAYHNENIVHQLYELYPYMEGYHINDVYQPVCDCWNVPPLNPRTKQAFYSSKPVLLADGAMDPACCPLYIDMIHHYFPNSQRLLFLQRSHGVGGDEMHAYTQQFLDHPYEMIETHNKDIVAY